MNIFQKLLHNLTPRRCTERPVNKRKKAEMVKKQWIHKRYLRKFHKDSRFKKKFLCNYAFQSLRPKSLQGKMCFLCNKYIDFIGVAIRICIFMLRDQKAYNAGQTDIMFDNYSCTFMNQKFYILPNFLYGSFLSYIL